MERIRIKVIKQNSKILIIDSIILQIFDHHLSDWFWFCLTLFGPRGGGAESAPPPLVQFDKTFLEN